MDINFTNQLAVSLSQSIILVIAAAVLGACVAGGVAIYRDIKNEENLKKQRRHLVYGQLKGRKSTLLQSYASYNSAIIRSEMLDCRSTLEAVLHRLEGMNPIEIENIRANSIEFTDGIRTKIRSEDLALQIAKSKERFWVAIGTIASVSDGGRAHFIT
jgi:hypothetical protein